MIKCKFEHDGHCCNCGATQYMIECKQPCETIVPMTNADCIRAMSDEELADFITEKEKGWCTEIGRKMYYEKNVEWLKQPAEGDVNDGR